MNRVLNFLLNFAACFGTITKRVVFFRKVTNNQRVSQILLANNM